MNFPLSVPILKNELLPNSTTRLLEVAKPKNFFFLPGEGVVLKLAGVARPYSFAQAQNEDCLRFYIRHQPQGQFSQALAACSTGQMMTITEKLEMLSICQNQDAVFIATGVGIAPFLSALKSYPEQRPKTIFYGARNRSDLVELAFLQSVCDDSTLKVTLSQEVHPNFRFGYVDQFITPALIEAHLRYYICGLDQMVQSVSSQLMALGAGSEQIQLELFYMKSPSR